MSQAAWGLHSPSTPHPTHIYGAFSLSAEDDP